MKIKNFLVVLLLIISGLCVNGAEISPESPKEIYDKAESYWYGENGVYMNRSKALELYNEAADKGYVYAQIRLGELYKEGEDVTMDLNRAVYWYTKAAEQDSANPPAVQLSLYECYKDMGNCEDAVRWLMLSVESGYDWAQITLGDCYMEGECIRYDASEAAKWYRIAAEKGNECAQYDLGRCYEKGLGVSVDAEQAVYWYGKAAEQGYTLAFSAMKDCYDSNGMAKDKVIALEKLAAAGNNSAKYSLAKCYVDADGVSRDLSKAVELFMELCDTGDDIDMASSAYMLYRICKMGETLPQGDAMYWLKKACSIQTKYIYPKAAYDLAKAYDTGDGVAQSNEQAMFWYKVGAENGDKDSQFEYAKKVTGDEKKHWLRCAAEAGHTMAQRFLAIIYYDEGYYSYAGHWFARAAQGGDVVAKTYLREYYGMYIE